MTGSATVNVHEGVLPHTHILAPSCLSFCSHFVRRVCQQSAWPSALQCNTTPSARSISHGAIRLTQMLLRQQEACAWRAERQVEWVRASGVSVHTREASKRQKLRHSGVGSLCQSLPRTATFPATRSALFHPASAETALQAPSQGRSLAHSSSGSKHSHLPTHCCQNLDGPELMTN